MSALITAAALFGGFVAFLFVGSRLVPGPTLEGAVLASGERKTYTLNGLALYLITLAAAGAGQLAGVWRLSALLDLFWPLFIVANVFAFALTGALYVVGRWVRPLEKEGRPRGLLAGLFYGVELNPTWWGVDLKFFSYRPSLIGLAVFNLAFAAEQWETQGELTLAMVLYQAFTLLYVLNYFQFEYGMVFTWDIIAERFGWMLVWGDYVLVPFFYCSAGWFVLARDTPLAPGFAVALVALYAFGFWLFRGANEQKHRFKMNPNAPIWGRPPRVIGGRLLASGFWGIGRHLNYTGELCVYLAFTMTAGFDSPVPYLLPAWLFGLLVHRAWRDDLRCRAKYGQAWVEYTQVARFKMFPFVY